MSDEENKEEPIDESSMNLDYEEYEYDHEYNSMNNNNNNEPYDDDIIDSYSEIDRIFEEVLMTYITSTRNVSIPLVSEPTTQSPYY